MKKFLIILFVCFAAGLLALAYILNSFDFDSMDGRGHQEKRDVQVGFEEVTKIKGVKSYILTQPFDDIRNRPTMSVRGRFWLGDGKVMDINGIGESTFHGDECTTVAIAGLRLTCMDRNKRLILACPTSLIDDVPNQLTITDIVEKYNSLLEVLQKYPSQEMLLESDIDYKKPKFKYGSLYQGKEESITCSVVRDEVDYTPPAEFHCDENFHKCVSSEDIEIISSK